MSKRFHLLTLQVFIAAVCLASPVSAADLERVRYNHPGLVVDLGVGLWVWPLPVDYDGDGDLDLLAACPDKPFNGVYFFENPGGGAKMPVFKPGVRLGRALRDMRISHVDGKARMLAPAHEFPKFRTRGFEQRVPIFHTGKIHPGKTRANQWSYADYDGDGSHDLIVGVGDWNGYGWDNAYDKNGRWKNDRLHGYVYLIRNKGTNAKPQYESPRRIEAGGTDVDVYGWPSPSFADFDNDGDLDLVCGEFLDGFTYFQNIGTRTAPRYLAGKRLQHRGERLRMDLQMITPTAVDWDGDGDVDLIVGQEDGRIALVEHSGKIVDGVPHFLSPKFFRQQAEFVKFGALSTPFSFDWDGDGDEDIVCGNTAGYIAFIENVDGAIRPKWAAPVLLKAGGRIIRIQAGPNGSIQGPCEAKWGYTTLSVADWNHDGLPDILVNSIWGEVLWYRNVGTRRKPKLAAAHRVEVEWPAGPPKPEWFWWQPNGKQLVTQWRTTPVAVDFTADGLTDLVMLDHEGYLALFERRRKNGRLELLSPRRIFVDEKGQPVRLNARQAGKSGRRKLTIADWDGDGRLDLLVNSTNADWWRNIGTRNGNTVLKQMGPLGKRNLSAHTTSPTVVDWNRDGKPDLLLGTEDGHLYYLEHNAALK